MSWSITFENVFSRFQLAQEAIEVEEKEEKLVSETAKHLTEANVQINFLSDQFYTKSDESRRQKEEITHLLAQVSPYTCEIAVRRMYETCQGRLDLVALIRRNVQMWQFSVQKKEETWLGKKQMWKSTF